MPAAVARSARVRSTPAVHVAQGGARGERLDAGEGEGGGCARSDRGDERQEQGRDHGVRWAGDAAGARGQRGRGRVEPQGRRLPRKEGTRAAGGCARGRGVRAEAEERTGLGGAVGSAAGGKF
eukprot:4450839-Prymnesium_polylepis.1